jgi:hypothetical protein
MGARRVVYHFFGKMVDYADQIGTLFLPTSALVDKNQIKWGVKNMIMEYNYPNYLIYCVYESLENEILHNCLEHSQLKGKLPSQEKHVQVEWKGMKI